MHNTPHTAEAVAKMREAHKNISEETRQKMSVARKGRPAWNKGLHVYTGGRRFEKGTVPWNKGMKMSEEFCKTLSNSHLGIGQSEITKQKISAALKGVSKPPRSESYRKALSLGHLGRIASAETRKKMSDSHKRRLELLGITSNYKSERHRIMNTVEYRIWRDAVFKRDDFTCQVCGERGGTLQAHHIVPWGMSVELRFDVSNGQTLCVGCHKKTDSYLNSYGRNQYVKAKDSVNLYCA